MDNKHQQCQPTVQYSAPPPGYAQGQPGQPPVYIATTYQPSGVLNPGFKAKRELGLGIATTVFGCILLISGFYTLSKGTSKYYQELWGGVLFLATGVMGIMAGKTRKNGYMIASIVLCVISAIISFVGFAMQAFVAVVTLFFGSNTDSRNEYGTLVKSGLNLLGIMALVSAILTLIIFIVVIVQAATCCKCCYGPEANQLQGGAPINAAV